MKKILVYLVSSTVLLAVGAFIGVYVLLNTGFYKGKPNEVWVAKQRIVTEEGFVIPEGSEMLLISHYPEGFSRINLAVNVEGEGLDLFKKEIRPARINYTPTPTWVSSNKQLKKGTLPFYKE